MSKISEMYTKKEIAEVKDLYDFYKNQGMTDAANRFFHVYLMYSAFTIKIFDIPISNN